MCAHWSAVSKCYDNSGGSQRHQGVACAPTDQQLANVMTKDLPRLLFDGFGPASASSAATTLSLRRGVSPAHGLSKSPRTSPHVGLVALVVSPARLCTWHVYTTNQWKYCVANYPLEAYNLDYIFLSNWFGDCICPKPVNSFESLLILALAQEQGHQTLITFFFSIWLRDWTCP